MANNAMSRSLTHRTLKALSSTFLAWIVWRGSLRQVSELGNLKARVLLWTATLCSIPCQRLQKISHSSTNVRMCFQDVFLTWYATEGIEACIAFAVSKGLDAVSNMLQQHLVSAEADAHSQDQNSAEAAQEPLLA